ncbi:cytochrome c551 [Bacillus sp. 2205SS5-2]|uniref:cytochrome c551 n=1 Tax=Bacillus sp. 2205SS5-2 TaxID=3109031 RepID=UPI0030045520
MKKKLFALMLGTSLVLAACGGDDGTTGTETDKNETTEETTDSTVATNVDVEKIVDQKCASCHGGNLEGGFGPKLDNIGSSLSKEEILSIINNGEGQMPKEIIKGEEAEAVAEWLANKK